MVLLIIFYINYIFIYVTLCYLFITMIISYLLLEYTGAVKSFYRYYDIKSLSPINLLRLYVHRSRDAEANLGGPHVDSIVLLTSSLKYVIDINRSQRSSFVSRSDAYVSDLWYMHHAYQCLSVLFVQSPKETFYPLHILLSNSPLFLSRYHFNIYFRNRILILSLTILAVSQIYTQNLWKIKSSFNDFAFIIIVCYFNAETFNLLCHFRY